MIEQIRQLLLRGFRNRLPANSARDGRNLRKRCAQEAGFAARGIPNSLTSICGRLNA